MCFMSFTENAPEANEPAQPLLERYGLLILSLKKKKVLLAKAFSYNMAKTNFGAHSGELITHRPY